MKNEKNSNFEDQVRLKLSNIDASLPKDGFKAIQNRLAIRRRKRGILLLLMILLLVGSMGTFVVFNGKMLDSKHNSEELQQATERAPGMDLPISVENDVVNLENQSIVQEINPDIKSKKSSSNSVKLSNNSNVEFQNQVVKKLNSIANVQEIRPKASENSQTTASTDGSSIDESPNKNSFSKEVMANLDPSNLEITQFLTNRSFKSIFHEHYSPVFSNLPLPANKVSNGLSWKWSIIPGLHFYHVKPNKSDDIHFFKIENPGNDWNISAEFSVHQNLTKRIAFGIHGQYSVTHSNLMLQSIEKNAGKAVVLDEDPVRGLYRNYSLRSDKIAGQFYQIGLGGSIQYQFLENNRNTIYSQLNSFYFQTLNSDKELLFPNQELRLGMSLGWNRAIGAGWVIGMQPGFSYGLPVSSSSEMLRINRMIFSVGISVSRN